MCDYCSWIDRILAQAKLEAEAAKARQPPPVDPVVIVHGGAGRIPLIERKYMLEEVKNAAVFAYKELIKGCRAIDAVEHSICYMESRKYFNCARGGSVDTNGEVVMDAGMMMTGYNMGCVGAVRDIEHPISLAKMVLQDAPHILLVESGAQKFALDKGVRMLPPGFLLSVSTPPPSISSLEKEGEEEDNNFLHFDPSVYDEYIKDNETQLKEKLKESGSQKSERRKRKKRKNMPWQINEEEFEEDLYEGEESSEASFIEDEPIFLEVGGVGAAAYDRKKHFASGSSTAGQQGKLIGSISPISTVIGCGLFANENGCVSMSGDDRAIYKYAPARKIIRRLGEETIDGAVLKELNKFELETGEQNIGAIALGAKGSPFVSFKCLHFPWAYCQLGHVYYGSTKTEHFSEKIRGLERPLDCMCGKLL